MAAQTKFTWQSVGIDKKPLQKIVAELHKEMGIEHDPDMTPQKVREMMRQEGIRAEDNIFSSGIIAAREEGENREEMAAQTKFAWQSVAIDKKPLQSLIAEMHRIAGGEHDPDMTPEKLQQRMLASGIRAEDNLASCGIIEAREEGLSGEEMTTQTKSAWQFVGIDKKPLQEAVAKLHKEMGIEHDPDMTPEKLRALCIEQGIRPEDNILSCGIIAARDEE